MNHLIENEADWLRSVAAEQREAAQLLSKSEREQKRLGYLHTLREICQQPFTIEATCAGVLAQAPRIQELLKNIRSLILTGSGSSEYAGGCVRFAVQHNLGLVTQAIAGGALLTEPGRVLPPERPGLVVSLARSGNSPESAGALSLLLEIEPQLRHLVITCNSEGDLASRFRGDERVHVLTLDDRTNDRSLVMTSSFTGLVTAARFLASANDVAGYKGLCSEWRQLVSHLLLKHFDSFSRAGSISFARAVFLASSSSLSAAREAALKMLEMTAGRVTTMAETYLGFRHGPMSYVTPQTVLVCFLSGDPMLRAYESDLLEEVNRKNLGMFKVVVGENIPPELLRHNDISIECPGLNRVAPDDACIVHVVAGQLLAFFRCLKEGLRPDSPSENGIINRVVDNFALHLPGLT